MHIDIYTEDRIQRRRSRRLAHVNSSSRAARARRRKKKMKRNWNCVCVWGLLMRRTDYPHAQRNGNETHQVFASNNDKRNRQIDRAEKNEEEAEEEEFLCKRNS